MLAIDADDHQEHAGTLLVTSRARFPTPASSPAKLRPPAPLTLILATNPPGPTPSETDMWAQPLLNPLLV